MCAMQYRAQYPATDNSGTLVKNTKIPVPGFGGPGGPLLFCGTIEGELCCEARTARSFGIGVLGGASAAASCVCSPPRSQRFGAAGWRCAHGDEGGRASGRPRAALPPWHGMARGARAAERGDGCARADQRVSFLCAWRAAHAARARRAHMCGRLQCRYRKRSRRALDPAAIDAHRSSFLPSSLPHSRTPRCRTSRS